MAGPIFLQAKLKLGAFPVSHSWFLDVLHNLCIVGSVFVATDAKLGNLSGRAIVAVKIIKIKRRSNMVLKPHLGFVFGVL